MSDFYQSATITTLHELAVTVPSHSPDNTRPIVAVLPVHAKDLVLQSIRHTVSVLSQCEWLSETVVCLDHTDFSDITRAHDLFAPLGSRLRLINTAGLRTSECFKRIAALGLPGYVPGKGSNAAVGLWYISATRPNAIALLHDIDITVEVYNRGMLWRLVAPLAPTESTLHMSKAYYARVHSNEFKGRVTRLLMWPLLDVLGEMLPSNGLISFLREFRYILSGELALAPSALPTLRISQTWGFDLRLLGEMWRQGLAKYIAQVPLTTVYDHRHPELATSSLGESSPRGVVGMAMQICLTLWDMLADSGVCETDAFMCQVCERFPTRAAEYVSRYAIDARYNGFAYNISEEHSIVQAFYNALSRSCRELRCGTTDRAIPNWTSIVQADPGFSDLVQTLPEGR